METPLKIKNQVCTVMTVPTIEDAERICSIWDRFKLTETQYMRVCIHPYSYRKRPNYILSRHPLFKENFDINEAKKHVVKIETEQPKTNEQITPLTKPQEAD